MAEGMMGVRDLGDQFRQIGNREEEPLTAQQELAATADQVQRNARKLDDARLVLDQGEKPISTFTQTADRRTSRQADMGPGGVKIQSVYPEGPSRADQATTIVEQPGINGGTGFKVESTPDGASGEVTLSNQLGQYKVEAGPETATAMAQHAVDAAKQQVEQAQTELINSDAAQQFQADRAAAIQSQQDAFIRDSQQRAA